MEIILIDKIKNLGDVGDIVKVRSGYARNYLIPYGKAKFATEENRLEIQQRRAEYERHVSEERALAKERAEKLEGLELTIKMQAMEDGRLYGPVSITEVCELVLQKCGIEIQKQEVNFPEGQIRSLGSHSIVFNLHSDVQVETQLEVVAAKQSSSYESTQKESSDTQTSQQNPDDQLPQETSDDQPQKENPDVQPLQENLDDQLPQETSDDQPQKENPDAQPQKENPDNQSQQENPEDQLQQENPDALKTNNN